MKELSNRLEQLLLHQSFADLNAADKTYVLSQMTAEEYEQYHSFLGCTTHTFRQFSGKANPLMKANLLAKVRQNKPKAASFWQPFLAIFSYRVPAWQVGFGMLLFLGAFWWGAQNSDLTDLPAKEFVYQTDTIYKEIVKTISSTVLADTSDRIISIKPIPVHPSTAKASDFKVLPMQSDGAVIAMSDTSSNPILAGQNGLIKEAYQRTLFHLNVSPKGRSIGEDTALMKFVVEVY